MCFVNEADWYASVVESTTPTAEKPAKCDECGATIGVGETFHHLYMHEHEECGTCEDGECECPKDKDGDCIGGCQCDPPNIGETFDWDCCNNCFDFLTAVRMAEIDAGCAVAESVPSLGMMRSDIGDGGMEEARKYWRKAIELFPDLKASGYLGKLWRQIFVWHGVDDRHYLPK